jgi:hypothetical protein
MGFAQESASLPVGQIATPTPHGLRKHDVGWQVGSSPEKIARDGACMRRVHTARKLTSRLHDLPTGVMDCRPAMKTGSDNRKSIRNLGVKGQYFGDLDTGCIGWDRLEGTAYFRWRIRFHVERIQLARGAQVKNHDGRPFAFARIHLASFCRSKVLRQPEANAS